MKKDEAEDKLAPYRDKRPAFKKEKEDLFADRVNQWVEDTLFDDD